MVYRSYQRSVTFSILLCYSLVLNLKLLCFTELEIYFNFFDFVFIPLGEGEFHHYLHHVVPVYYPCLCAGGVHQDHHHVVPV